MNEENRLLQAPGPRSRTGTELCGSKAPKTFDHRRTRGGERRFLSLLLMLCLIIGLMPMPVARAEGETAKDIWVKADGSGDGSSPASPLGSMSGAISLIRSDGEHTDFVIHLMSDLTLPNATSFSKDNISITLRSDDGDPATEKEKYTIFRGANSGAMINFTSFSGTLTLQNIILDGKSETYSNSSGAVILVQGSNDCRLVLDEGAVLKNNSRSNSGGAVQIKRGTLVMNEGSSITGNHAASAGGGVSIESIGGAVTFTMNGGSITDNTSGNNGGGVFVQKSDTSSSGKKNSFIMNGGEISGNTANPAGGGIYVGDNSSFTMTGGTVSENKANNTSSYYTGFGGGVYFTSRAKIVLGDDTTPTNPVIIRDNLGDFGTDDLYLNYGTSVDVKKLADGTRIGLYAGQTYDYSAQQFVDAPHYDVLNLKNYTSDDEALKHLFFSSNPKYKFDLWDMGGNSKKWCVVLKEKPELTITPKDPIVFDGEPVTLAKAGTSEANTADLTYTYTGDGEPIEAWWYEYSENVGDDPLPDIELDEAPKNTGRYLLGLNAPATNNFTSATVGQQFIIHKASARDLPDIRMSQSPSVTDAQSREIGSGGMPTNAGTLTYAKGTESHTGSVTVTDWNVDATGRVTYTLSGGNDGDTVTLPVVITSRNYEDSTVQVVITLNHIPDTITVTYTWASGSNTPDGAVLPTSAVIEENTPFTAEQPAAVQNFRFIGWYTDDGCTALYVDGTALADDTTLYGKWEELRPVTYSITVLSSGNGTALANKTTAAAGEQITLTATPQSGYRFSGWQVIAGGVTITGNAFTMPASHVTVKALFESTGGGGGSSSGGSGSTTYPPIIKDTDNGNVTVSPSRPERDDVVIIRPNPDKGYEVDDVVVTKPDGTKVPVKDRGDGTWSYVQPGVKVTVKVTFKKIESNTYDQCKHGKGCPLWPFEDVTSDAWYHDGVHYCLDNGLMNGKSDTIFDPNGTTTRGQIVAMLWRLEGKPKVEGDSYADVTAGQYYTEAVAWAAVNGIVTGYNDGTFKPNAPITREQMATILYRYCKYKGIDISVGEDTNILSYNDATTVAEYAVSALQWATGAGVISGKQGGILDPKGSTTRAQVATILMRFCVNIVKK